MHILLLLLPPLLVLSKSLETYTTCVSCVGHGSVWCLSPHDPTLGECVPSGISCSSGSSAVHLQSDCSEVRNLTLSRPSCSACNIHFRYAFREDRSYWCKRTSETTHDQDGACVYSSSHCSDDRLVDSEEACTSSRQVAAEYLTVGCTACVVQGKVWFNDSRTLGPCVNSSTAFLYNSTKLISRLTDCPEYFNQSLVQPHLSCLHCVASGFDFCTADANMTRLSMLDGICRNKDIGCFEIKQAKTMDKCPGQAAPVSRFDSCGACVKQKYTWCHQGSAGACVNTSSLCPVQYSISSIHDCEGYVPESPCPDCVSDLSTAWCQDSISMDGHSGYCVTVETACASAERRVLTHAGCPYAFPSWALMLIILTGSILVAGGAFLYYRHRANQINSISRNRNRETRSHVYQPLRTDVALTSRRSSQSVVTTVRRYESINVQND